jgi:hypothetical protein
MTLGVCTPSRMNSLRKNGELVVRFTCEERSVNVEMSGEQFGEQLFPKTGFSTRKSALWAALND